MLVKFMPKGRCGLDYCLGKHVHGRDVREPRVLIGNPKQADALIKSVDFANPFTSVVLSYEKKISSEQAQKDIESFESVLMPGLTPGLEYDRVWIEHTETPKDPATKLPIEGEQRTALHCIIPNLHLPTGKRLQPYFDRVDRARIEAWQELTNAENGYASAKDPMRRRATVLNVHSLPRNVAEVKVELERAIVANVNAEQISTRDDLCKWLGEQGFHVERITKKSISVSHPTLKKNLRLEGSLYEYGGLEETARERDSGEKPIHRVSQDRTDEFRHILSAGLERKRAELQERFARRDEDSSRRLEEDDRRRTASVERGTETMGDRETKGLTLGSAGGAGRGVGDGQPLGGRDLDSGIEGHGNGLGGPSAGRNLEAGGLARADRDSDQDVERGSGSHSEATGRGTENVGGPSAADRRAESDIGRCESPEWAAKQFRRQERGDLCGSDARLEALHLSGKNPHPSENERVNHERGTDESDPNRTAIIRHAEAAGSAYERVRGLAEAFGRTILRAIKGRFRIRPADREQITRATECVDAYHRNFARGVEQYARRAAETHEEIGRLEAADSAARRIFEDAERTSAAIDQATQHLDGAGQLGRIAAVILARRPLRKLEALRRDYAKTQDKRLVEEAKVWADTQDGPNLTRIPLGVHAQDYVRGDPNITRKELEQQFFENRQAMRELVRQGRLWHEQHPHQEQQQSPKRGRGMGRG